MMNNVNIKDTIAHAEAQYRELEPQLDVLRRNGIERTWKEYDFLCSRPLDYEHGSLLSETETKTALKKVFSEGYEGVLYFHIPYCNEVCRFCSYTLVLHKDDKIGTVLADDNPYMTYAVRFVDGALKEVDPTVLE